MSITGTGTITYDAQYGGNVVKVGANGVDVNNTGDYTATPGSISITSAANIYAANTAVKALNAGTGAVTINTVGATLRGDTDNGGAGLAVNTMISNTNSTADISITTGDAYTYGGAGTTTTGIESVIAAANKGLGGIDIDTTAGEVKSITYNDPTNGDYSPSAIGNAGVGNASGISALIDNTDSSGDITINTGDVSGKTYGIYASNAGSGDTAITTTGEVYALNTGVLALNSGTGAVTVNTVGATVLGDTDNGGMGLAVNTLISNASSTADISITTGNAYTYGGGGTTTTGINSVIAAANKGLGGIDIDTTAGEVKSITYNDPTNGDYSASGIGAASGISALIGNLASSRDITIKTGDVSGNGYGIYARTVGAGDIDITNGGSVTGTTGIYAWNSNATGTGDTKITATGDVTALDTAIEALNYGTGAVTVNTDGATVRGDTDNLGGGLAVNTLINNTSSTADISITTGNAYTYGGAGTTTTGINSVIAAANNGLGNIDIDTTNGEVETRHYTNPSTGDYSRDAAGLASGISALIGNGNSSGDITINTKDVSGNANGIYAKNIGSGDVNITNDGDVTGSNGIYGESADGNVNVTANGDVRGGSYGIHTETNNSPNNATRSANVTVNGTAAGTTAGVYQWGYTDLNTTIASGGLVKSVQADGTDWAPSVGSTKDAIHYDGWPTFVNHVVIEDGGTLIGNVISGLQGQDIIDNSGTWNNAGGTSILDAGVGSQFNNEAGGSYLAANATGSSVTTTLLNTDTVNDNGGDFVMQNMDSRIGGAAPVVGDHTSFTGSNFVTGGGNLLVDTNIANGTSDWLSVGSVTAGQTLSVPSDPSSPLVTNPTQVGVFATDGLGQPTTPYNNGDGILVVDVANTTDPGAFALNGISTEDPTTHTIVDRGHTGGLYTYSIGQGSGANSQNWYLQARLGHAAAAAGAVSVAGSSSALSSLANIHDRQRDVDTLSNNVNSRKGVWGRVFGQNNKFETKIRDNHGTTDIAGYNTDLWGVQAGMDIKASNDNAGNRKYAGLYVAYADSSGHTTNHGHNVGKMDLNTTSVGAYYTKYTSSNWYMDLVAQYSHIGGVHLKTANNDLSPGGDSYALSLEVGQQFNPKGSVISEVQAQLINQYTDMDNVTLADNSKLNVSSMNAVTGRFGVRVYGNPAGGKSFLPWVRANIWHTFSTSSKVSSMGNTLETPIGGTSGELELGFSKGHAKNGGWGFYGSAGYQFDISGAKYSGWKGTLGLRKGW